MIVYAKLSYPASYMPHRHDYIIPLTLYILCGLKQLTWILVCSFKIKAYDCLERQTGKKIQ